MHVERPVVVICGATAGVGRATAELFAACGHPVALIARSAAGLAEAEHALRAYGAGVLGISADVADADAVAQAAHRIEAELGSVGVWINAAMATVFAPIEHLTAEEIRRVTDVTYLGTVHGTLAALTLMRPRKQGIIVQVGSALAYRAIPLQSAYCAAKFAVRGFTDALRCELIHEGIGIKVSMVQLPAINTPQFVWARNKMEREAQPVPPVHDANVAARAIYSAAISPTRELWVGLSSVKAILGMAFIPGLLDRLLARSAWRGQLGPRKRSPDQADNLFQPVDGEHQRDGPFTRHARPAALVLSQTSVLATLMISAVVVLLLLL